MTDDPWFTYYRRGWHMQIVPRNAKGWAALVAFIAIVAAPAFLIGPLLESTPWLVVPYLAGILLVTILFIRWAIGRSERIDLDEIARDHAEFQEWKRRHGKDR